MHFNNVHKKALFAINEDNIVSEENLLKLLENCSKILAGAKEVCDIEVLSESFPIQFKQLYAALLYTLAESGRQTKSSEELSYFLITECNIREDKAKIIEHFYQKSTNNIKYNLLNIGSCVEHITDIRWKIDYTSKSSVLEQSEGPVFRISIKIEKYDPILLEPIENFINFTCNGREMQNLVYKVKDAVRHCYKIVNRSGDKIDENK